MTKNQIKHLTTTTLYLDNHNVIVILESIKNTKYGTPRYEAIVVEDYGTYKVMVEGYLGVSDMAYKAYKKVSEMTK